MKTSRLLRILGSILLLVTTITGDPVAARGTQIAVTINGLEFGDKATLSLSSKTASLNSAPILEETIVSQEDGAITVNIPVNLKDGNYELSLAAPEKYFRDPKAYWFKVYQSNIVNPLNKPIVFNLIPPSARNYTPYRKNNLSSGPSDNLTSNPTYRLEMAIMLSIPPKQPQTSSTLLSEGTGYHRTESKQPKTPFTLLSEGAGYHNAGPYTQMSNLQGVWGRFKVVDPGVRHNIYGVEFVTAHAMASIYTAIWMEIGWTEHSGYSDARKPLNKPSRIFV